MFMFITVLMFDQTLYLLQGHLKFVLNIIYHWFMTFYICTCDALMYVYLNVIRIWICFKNVYEAFYGQNKKYFLAISK